MDLATAYGLVNAQAQANNVWSAQQAQKQMDFQERMSNTAHQREMADLKAAGLNPVLSAGGAGAATPTGAMGGTDTSNTSALMSMLDKAISSASSSAVSTARVAEAINKTIDFEDPKNRYGSGMPGVEYRKENYHARYERERDWIIKQNDQLPRMQRWIYNMMFRNMDADGVHIMYQALHDAPTGDYNDNFWKAYREYQQDRDPAYHALQVLRREAFESAYGEGLKGLGSYIESILEQKRGQYSRSGRSHGGRRGKI